MYDLSAAGAAACRQGRPESQAPTLAQTDRTTHEDASSGTDDASWQPIVAEAVLNYSAYLKVLADRGLGSDLKSKGDASDLVQETFTEVYREYHRFEGLPAEEFKALLIRMLINNLKSFTRRYRGSLKREISREVPIEAVVNGRMSLLQLADTEASPSERASREEDQERLSARIDRLPERDRLALMWRMQDGRTYREIGKRLGCSAVAARKLSLRIIETLRRDLNAEAN
jgi:RNA polymerase sigma-70 factor (ECF subfamily)